MKLPDASRHHGDRSIRLNHGRPDKNDRCRIAASEGMAGSLSCLLGTVFCELCTVSATTRRAECGRRAACRRQPSSATALASESDFDRRATQNRCSPASRNFPPARLSPRDRRAIRCSASCYAVSTAAREARGRALRGMPIGVGPGLQGVLRSDPQRSRRRLHHDPGAIARVRFPIQADRRASGTGIVRALVVL